LQGVHRNIPGHGVVPTGQGVPPVVRHNDVPSVGSQPPDEFAQRERERVQKIADWRDKGTSASQVREGICAMFNLPSKE